MSAEVNKYVDSETEHFPLHWDEQTKQLVRFMIFEAYNAGHLTGVGMYRELYFDTHRNLNDVLERLSKFKELLQGI